MLLGFSLLSPALPQVGSPTITPNFFRVPVQSVSPLSGLQTVLDWLASPVLPGFNGAFPRTILSSVFSLEKGDSVYYRWSHLSLKRGSYFPGSQHPMAAWLSSPKFCFVS